MIYLIGYCWRVEQLEMQVSNTDSYRTRHHIWQYRSGLLLKWKAIEMQIACWCSSGLERKLAAMTMQVNHSSLSRRPCFVIEQGMNINTSATFILKKNDNDQKERKKGNKTVADRTQLLWKDWESAVKFALFSLLLCIFRGAPSRPLFYGSPWKWGMFAGCVCSNVCVRARHWWGWHAHSGGPGQKGAESDGRPDHQPQP